MDHIREAEMQPGSRTHRAHFRDRASKTWRRLRNRLSAPLELDVEAKKACDWLRAAGFPQYAQLYEDSQFPVDISCVKRDHSFLDQDSLKSLCRRLMTLNSCAPMKLDVHFQRKRNEDSDEDDQCAISDRWAFQRDQGRWSRLDSVELLSPTFAGPPTIKSTSSRDSILTDLSTELEATSLQSVEGSRGLLDIASTPPQGMSSLSSSPAPTKPCRSLSDQSLAFYNRGQKEKTKKKKTKGFLKRMESLRKREKDKKKVELPLLVTNNTEVDDSGKNNISFPNECDDGDIPVFEKDFLHPGYRTKCASSGSLRKSHPNSPCNEVYMEDFEVGGKNSLRHRPRKTSDQLVCIPVDHKPGTFPRSLSIESLCPGTRVPLENWKMGSKSLGQSVCSSMDSHCLEGRPRRGSFSSLGSRSSIYDNVPSSLAGSGDLLELGGHGDLFEHLDDVLNHVRGLQRMVEMWSRTVCPELDEGTDSGGEHIGHLNYEERSMSDVGTSASDFDSTGNSLNDTEETEMRERRDSGVGASLTRPCRKLRWHSFQNSHRPSLSSASLEINRQSAAQLNLLQKLSLLRLTAIMEKHSVPSKQGWAWTVPKFMKRSKVPDYKGRAVFGVPPIINVQRTGQPLPQSIQQAMRYIRSQCLDQVGIFRKSGVKSRIQVLRQMNESSPDHVSYTGQSAYDVADLLKQYFRDLPEPIFTSKLTDTFLQIYQYVPKDQRLRAVQAAILLMPDENREVLQTLLYFLSDISSAQENQMTPGNLAVCLAPSVFHLNISKKESTSPRVLQKRGTSGKPDHKDLSENMAATQGLLHMITECKKLFQIPHDMMLQSRNSYISADAQPLSLEELCGASEGEARDSSFLDNSIQELLQDSAERFKSWASMPGPENTELSCKKVGDGNPMRMWKVSTEVEAPPSSLLHRVLRERHLWDDDLLQGKVVETLEQNMEIFHYVTDTMAPHPRRQFLVLRKWRTDLPRGGCLLVSTSLDHATGQPEEGVQAVILNSQYLMEPCGMGRSKLTYICRTDLRGRSPDWYNKVFGHLCAMEVARIRNSFPPLNPCGPETKL
ncbi:stAR-related lipid transfer protein 8 isoform X1 [Spea bombifrons]|uniref:stAR-related lipid transfer protein 8 isoform X1 n=2 Tax=Spea bombifrons TaxID=233779 RepID=UPI00234A6221|nr:stAR-related lipid transfer protein 8 isoform X1 [Spea bombifrons]